MSDERSCLARADGKANSGVDLVREESDAVFKVITDNLHDTGAVLHYCYFGRKEHFSSAIEKAVNGLGVLVPNVDEKEKCGQIVVVEDIQLECPNQ